jgi:hypothetical protein
MTLIPTNVATAADSKKGKSKQIAIRSATSNEALYTVASGRKFSGQAWGYSTTVGAVFINSVEVQFAGSSNTITPLVLAEGAVVTKYSSAVVYIVGVEEDA